METNKLFVQSKDKFEVSDSQILKNREITMCRTHEIRKKTTYFGDIPEERRTF